MKLRSRIHSAFTLIELLTVIAIIAVLLALIMPSLQSAMDASKVASCLANLKSIGGGIAAYSADHEQQIPYGPAAGRFTGMASFYPSTGSPTSLISLDGGAPVALGMLVKDYLGRTPEVLFCPGNDQAMNAQKELAKFGHEQAQCGYYYRHAGNTKLYDEGLSSPPMQIGNLGLNRNGKPIRAVACDITFLPPPGLKPLNINTTSNHRGHTTNVLYVDGRVASFANDGNRFTVDVRKSSMLDRSFSLILAVFERADEL